MKTPQIPALPGMTPLGIPDRRSLRAIALEIRKVWAKVHPWAEPYLQAMMELNNVSEMFGHDDAKSIVFYFLSNATYWRGPDAKRIKAELKALVNSSK